jgi:hypothetical protein
MAVLVGVGRNFVKYRPLRCFGVVAWKHIEMVVGTRGEGRAEISVYTERDVRRARREP